VATRAPRRTIGKLNILRARHLTALPWLVHGFSTRLGGFSRSYGKGDLNLSFTKDDSRAVVERNRAAFLRVLGACAEFAIKGQKLTSGARARPCFQRLNGTSGTRALPVSSGKESSHNPPRTAKGARRESDGGGPLWSLITLRQIHSDIIHCVDSAPEEPLFGDGLLTTTPGLLLAIQTADCLPIILVDAQRRAVGVFHAGWRGTVKRIVEKGVGEMFRHFGSRPHDLRAAIGPGIQGCCYEVGTEVRDKFESQFAYAANLFREVKEPDPVREKYPLLFLNARAPGHGELPNKIFLDLVEANRQQLLAAGVPKKNVETSPLCTNCHPELLFSHRAEKGKTGRMMGVVGIRELL